MAVLVGVLALQGAVTPHLHMMQRVGIDAAPVRDQETLQQCSHLIIPGGESTTMLKLIKKGNLWEALSEFGKKRPVWGVCAGAILIAHEVTSPEQESLKLLPLKAERNHYGSQRESFSASLNSSRFPSLAKVDFIRAPLLSPLSAKVNILGYLNDQPVFFQYGKTLASSFHIELTNDPTLHQYFASL